MRHDPQFQLLIVGGDEYMFRPGHKRTPNVECEGRRSWWRERLWTIGDRLKILWNTMIEDYRGAETNRIERCDSASGSSEQRRAGTECVSRGRSRWSRYNKKINRI